MSDEREQRDEDLLTYALRRTHVVRPPRQQLATFGSTSIKYHLVTEPAYNALEIEGSRDEVVIREGMVRAEQPQVVTPQYLLRHEGFGDHADGYLKRLAQQGGADYPGLLYAYKNEGMRANVASGDAQQVAHRLKRWLDREERGLEAVIRGVEELWDVSLMKFIVEITTASVKANVAEMHARGLLDMEGGLPREARDRIEHLLGEARRGNLDPSVVHQEIERWGAFDEYQDRFLSIFKSH